MARKTPSRLQMRKEVEAADARGTTDGKKEKAAKDKDGKPKAKRKTTVRRTKEKVSQRKRLVWGVYNSSMKEEARFPYDQRAEAEKRVKQLAAKSSKTYFIQPIKEPIADAPPVA